MKAISRTCLTSQCRNIFYHTRFKSGLLLSLIGICDWRCIEMKYLVMSGIVEIIKYPGVVPFLMIILCVRKITNRRKYFSEFRLCGFSSTRFWCVEYQRWNTEDVECNINETWLPWRQWVVRDLSKEWTVDQCLSDIVISGLEYQIGLILHMMEVLDDTHDLATPLLYHSSLRTED